MVLSVGSFLALTLLCSLVLLVPATVGVFTVRPHGRPGGAPRALAAGALVGLAALATARLLDAGWVASCAVAAVLAGSVPLWRRAGRAWATRGLVAWALTVDTGLAFLGYVLHWMLTSSLGLAGSIAAGLLWVVELFVFVLALGYVWELVDVLARREWPRGVDLRDRPRHRAEPHPFVSLHVPTHNEPPDMVLDTLRRLLELDYDDYEILLVDNNTDDPQLWRPVEEFCSRHDRIRFFHLPDWPGYKSGALNFALSRTDPRARVVGVVDADYLVEPDFLDRCAPLFADPDVAFVQTPQDYREWEHAGYFRRLYHSYSYFFEVSQRSRNERNGAIFGGTMGLIRRDALEAVGGWDEWCITEDAELSLRLLRAGWTGLHVAESFGRGIMPLSFEALKRQRFRWCFGGVQILRMHWRSLLPARRSEDNRLTLGQRWSYLVGGLQWFGDLAGLLFTGFLLLGVADAVAGTGVAVRRLSGPFLVCVAVLVVLGAVRALALVRRTSGASWKEAVGAFGLWLGLGWVVAQASVRGLVAREGAFLRTPKVRGELGWRDALNGNRVEAVLAMVCLLAVGVAWAEPTPARAVVGALLAVQAAGYAAAPLNSLSAVRSYLPPALRRRRLEKLPSWTRRAASSRLALVPVVTCAAAVTAFVVLAGPATGPGLGDIPSVAVGPQEDRTTDSEPPSTPTSPSPTTRRSGQPPAPASSVPGPTATGATPRPTSEPRPAATRPATRPTSTPSTSQPQPTQATTPTEKARPTQAASPTKPTQAAGSGPKRP